MSDRKVFNDSVTSLPDQGTTPSGFLVNAATDDHSAEMMQLHFSLQLPNQQELERRVEAGETVSLDELAGKYSPAQDDVDKLTSWLKSEGFEITHVTPDRTGVYAKASVAQIEKSFQVNMVRVTKGGLGYTSAQGAPSLPADVAQNVRAIIGLQPFRQAHKHLKALLPKDGNRALTATGPNPNVPNAPPYLVSEVLAAYNASDICVTGAGQTIAILIDTVPLDSDLQAFWRQNCLNVALGQIQKINVNGTQLPPPEGEETLDVSWSSAVAPGATIKVYASGSLAFAELDLALDRILADAATDPSLRQVSISLGLGEQFMGNVNGEIATQHQKYLQLAALGVNVFVSSGDAGSNPDETGHGSGPTPQVEYASSDPCVVGVGGTSLVLAGDGTVANETAWSSGGGGKSIAFEQQPAWQKGNGVPAVNQRLVPDVSLTADPNEGAFLVLNGVAQQFGGTSWSAPVWAAFCALINEARANAGKPSVPFLNPIIYPLIGTACFRDVVSGTNGAYSATAGYDMVTGIGVPNVQALITELTR